MKYFAVKRLGDCLNVANDLGSINKNMTVSNLSFKEKLRTNILEVTNSGYNSRAFVAK